MLELLTSPLILLRNYDTLHVVEIHSNVTAPDKINLMRLDKIVLLGPPKGTYKNHIICERYERKISRKCCERMCITANF